MSQINRSLLRTGIKPYDLKKVVTLDSRKYPLFGGEPVHLDDYILSENETYSEEDDIYTQQRIACARGVIMLNYNDFPVEVQEKMSYIKESFRNVHPKGTDEWVAKEGEILTYTPTVYFQHVRNRLLAEKMVEIEEDHFIELQASGRPYSDKSALDSKKSLFKARMIDCERHICQQYGGNEGDDFKCWSDDPYLSPEMACAYQCPWDLYSDYKRNLCERAKRNDKSGNDFFMAGMELPYIPSNTTTTKRSISSRRRLQLPHLGPPTMPHGCAQIQVPARDLLERAAARLKKQEQDPMEGLLARAAARKKRKLEVNDKDIESISKATNNTETNDDDHENNNTKEASVKGDEKDVNNVPL